MWPTRSTPAVRQGQPRTHLGNAVANPRIRACHRRPGGLAPTRARGASQPPVKDAAGRSRPEVLTADIRAWRQIEGDRKTSAPPPRCSANTSTATVRRRQVRDAPSTPSDTDMPQAKKPRKQAATATGSSPGPQLPDRRAMEAFLAPLSGRQADAALHEAQDLMYRAWETTGRQARINLAKRALEISPLCADAYVLLAEEECREPARRPRRSTRAASRPASSPSGRRPSRRMSATSGAPRDPALHARPRRACPSLWTSGSRRRGDRPLSRHAPAQSGRQPGHPLRPRRRPARDRRRRGPAGALEGVRPGWKPLLDLHQGALGVPRRRRHRESRALLAEAVELERACSRLSERRERPSQDRPRLHHPGRRGRGGRVRAGLRRGLEAHGRRARLAPAGGRRAPHPRPRAAVGRAIGRLPRLRSERRPALTLSWA